MAHLPSVKARLIVNVTDHGTIVGTAILVDALHQWTFDKNTDSSDEPRKSRMAMIWMNRNPKAPFARSDPPAEP